MHMFKGAETTCYKGATHAQAMFSRPFPEFSCQLNAWVTALTCQWLMGPSQVNDVELPDGTTAKAQGVLVER